MLHADDEIAVQCEDISLEHAARQKQKSFDMSRQRGVMLLCGPVRTEADEFSSGRIPARIGGKAAQGREPVICDSRHLDVTCEEHV